MRFLASNNNGKAQYCFCHLKSPRERDEHPSLISPSVSLAGFPSLAYSSLFWFTLAFNSKSGLTLLFLATIEQLCLIHFPSESGTQSTDERLGAGKENHLLRPPGSLSGGSCIQSQGLFPESVTHWSPDWSISLWSAGLTGVYLHAQF